MNMPKESIHLNPASVHTGLLINNEDRAGEGALLRVVNPATEEMVAEFAGRFARAGRRGRDGGEDGVR